MSNVNCRNNGAEQLRKQLNSERVFLWKLVTGFGLRHRNCLPQLIPPVALGPEDLKAGNVDVAVMGASVDMSGGMRGTAWGPQAVRTAERVVPWGEGDLFKVGHPSVGDFDFMQILNVVDYGDARKHRGGAVRRLSG